MPVAFDRVEAQDTPMRVMLDEEICVCEADTVGQAIEAALTLAEDRGRLIVDVVVDGRTWTGPQLSDVTACGQSAEEVRLTTADPAALLVQTLTDASEALGRADQLQRQAAELIEANRVPEAMQDLSEALDTWSEAQQALPLCAQVAGVDLDQLCVEGTPVPQLIEALNQQLRLIRSALESQDPIGLSDTLQYELPEVVLAWRELFHHLRDLVDGKGRA